MKPTKIMRSSTFITRFFPLLLLVFFLLAVANSAAAKEPYERFLRALQENGYGDVALEYLDRIEKRPDLPATIRETLDLQRSASLRMASLNAYDARQSEQLLADAQKYLDKFLKAHPDHPAAASAILSWGDSLFDLGQRSLATAERAPDEQRKAKLFAESREYFAQAGDRYAEALKRFLARLAQLPPDDDARSSRKSAAKNSAVPSERETAELGTVLARFKIGLVKYHLAHTYEDLKDSERTALLKAAADIFDGIFQEYRLTLDERPTFAHLWHGKTMEELGDEQTAMDIFDEVLANAPDGATGPASLASLYTQAMLFRFSTLRKQGKLDELVGDGSKWIESHKGWAKFPYYCGASLELAKAYQTQAEKATGEAQRKILQKAAIVLADVAKFDGEYKSEILLLRRDLLKQLGTENVGAAEFIALGDAALRENNLAEAKKYFEQSLQKALDAKDQKSANEAKLAINRATCLQIQVLFENKKYGDALDAAELLDKGDAADASVVGAAELALRSAYYLGVASEDKEKAYAKLEKIADFVKNKWPGRPVADMARMVLAQSHLQKGDTAGALELFGQVKPESSRYPWALFNIGRIRWYTYLEEKKKEAGRNETLMADAVTKASESLQNCVDLLQKSPSRKLPGDEGNDRTEEAQAQQLFADAQLLRCEIFLEGKEYQKAEDAIGTLVEKIKADQAKLNDSAIAIFMAAIRTRLALDEIEKAAADAVAMLALSEDEAKANAKLVNIARLLNQELKSAEAVVTDAQGGDPQNLAALAAKRDAFKELLVKLMEPLGKRREHSLPDLVFLGDACFTLGLADEGGQIYQNLLDRAKDDPSFTKKPGIAQALIRARAQLINVLRSQGKLEEALKQADEQIAKNPRALDPKMAKAYILDDWAKQDFRKFDDAVAQWTEIRLLLNRINPKPPEYFEVVYRGATCLYQQYEKFNDRSKLDSAEQLLKATLIQYAKLSGPDMVARYNELLKKIQEAGKKKGDRG
jgi:hypothetical protein